MTNLTTIRRTFRPATRVARSLCGVASRRFVRDFEQFRGMASEVDRRFVVRWEDRLPCLADAGRATRVDRHYVYHTAWAARLLARLQPARHYDFSSLHYFATLVSAFVPVTYCEFQPGGIRLPGLRSLAANLLSLPFVDDSLPSMSCMHVLEHLGLGRYGDPLDPQADRKAAAELRRVLTPGGMLIVVVPVGRPALRFNAHRVYSHGQVLDMFEGLQLLTSALIPDSAATGNIIPDPTPELIAAQRYGCGCFLFTKEGR